MRRRLRLPDDGRRRGPARRDAALQVGRQQDPDARREPAARLPAHRVPLRLPRLQRRRAAPSCRSSATPTTSTSTPRSSCSCSTAGSGSWRSRSRPTTATRSATSTGCGTPATWSATSCSTGWPRSASAPASWVPTGDEYRLKEGEGTSHTVVVDMLADLPPQRVLDLGCSGGRLAEQLRKLGHHVAGVDGVEIDGVRDRVDGFVLGDLEDGIPAAAGGGFDVVDRRGRHRALVPAGGAAAADGGGARARRRDHPVDAELRPLVPPGPGGHRHCSTTTGAASSTRPTCASSPGAACCAPSGPPGSRSATSATPACRSTCCPSARGVPARLARRSTGCWSGSARRCSATSSCCG